jgi:hypothetical protein
VKKRMQLLLLVPFCMSLLAQPQNTQQVVVPPEPPMLGVHWARGAAAAGGRGGSSTLLTYHNGSVMRTSVTLPIYWGASWGNASFVGDKISGLASFYSGEGGSSYAATCNEYTDTTGAVTSTSTYLGSIVDLSDAAKNGNRTSPILQEVCAALAAHNVTPVTNGYYPVYVDTPRGHSGFCAWHSWGTCNNVPIQFAFFFNLDGDAGCDPEDTSEQHSQGLAALANVSGHELSEARTDPRGAGWYDKSGAENADKCAWAFGTPLLTFSNRSMWKIQGNWSNAAYTAGRGYANRSGEDGCLDGGNFK